MKGAESRTAILPSLLPPVRHPPLFLPSSVCCPALYFLSASLFCPSVPPSRLFFPLQSAPGRPPSTSPLYHLPHSNALIRRRRRASLARSSASTSTTRWKNTSGPPSTRCVVMATAAAKPSHGRSEPMEVSRQPRDGAKHSDSVIPASADTSVTSQTSWETPKLRPFAGKGAFLRLMSPPASHPHRSRLLAQTAGKGTSVRNAIVALPNVAGNGSSGSRDRGCGGPAAQLAVGDDGLGSGFEPRRFAALTEEGIKKLQRDSQQSQNFSQTPSSAPELRLKAACSVGRKLDGTQSPLKCPAVFMSTRSSPKYAHRRMIRTFWQILLHFLAKRPV